MVPKMWGSPSSVRDGTGFTERVLGNGAFKMRQVKISMDRTSIVPKNAESFSMPSEHAKITKISKHSSSSSYKLLSSMTGKHVNHTAIKQYDW